MQNVVASYYDRHWARKISDDDKTVSWNWRDHRITTLIRQHSDPCSVLDVGCGTGHLLKIMSSFRDGMTLVGVEPSPVAATQAKKLVPDAIIHNCFGDDMHEVAGDTFDVVTMYSVIEHVYDVHALLNEVNRALKAGGVCAIYTTDFNWLKKVFVAAFAFDRYFDVTGGHIRFFTRRSLQALMTIHGFDLLHYEWDKTYLGLMPQGQNALFRKVKPVRFEPDLTKNTV